MPPRQKTLKLRVWCGFRLPSPYNSPPKKGGYALQPHEACCTLAAEDPPALKNSGSMRRATGFPGQSEKTLQHNRENQIPTVLREEKVNA